MTPQGARLWLVRHGETDWNTQGRIQGHTPTELNAVGHKQAAALADFFSSRKFAAVISSDLARAYQTAEAIAGPHHLPVEKTPDLRERSFGQYEGQTMEQIHALRTSLGLPQRGDLADWTGIPGVESNDVLYDRVAKVLVSLSERFAGNDVLVVTHGGVLARVVYRTLNIPDALPRRFPLANGIIAVLQYRIDAFYLLSLFDANLIAGLPTHHDTSTVPIK